GPVGRRRPRGLGEADVQGCGRRGLEALARVRGHGRADVRRRPPRCRRCAALRGARAARAEGRPAERMTDLAPNMPEVVAEVRGLFERYEQALIDKDVEVLDNTFWNSPHTIRYALQEHGYGFDEIHAARVARPPGP